MPCKTKRKRKREHYKKGQITIFLVFIILAVTLLIVTAVVAPMGITFTEKMYEAGQNIMTDNNESLANIDDAGVRDQIRDSLNVAMDAQQDNIDVYSDIYQYGWIIALVLIGFVMFLYTRRLVEYGGYGGFV